MFKDFLYSFLILYESDDTYLALTFGASNRIYVIDFLNKTSPIFSVLFGCSVPAKVGIFDRFVDGGESCRSRFAFFVFLL